VSYKLAAALLGLAIFAVPSARADTFHFGDCSQITTPIVASCPGPTQLSTLAYSTASGSVTATSSAAGGALATFFLRDTPGMMGLGVEQQGHAMISAPFLVNLDFSDLLAHNLYDGVLSVSGEAGSPYEICFGNTVGELGGNCVSGSYSGLINLPISWTESSHVLGITTTDAWGVSVQSLAVPEPGTLSLMTAGMIGLLALGFRRQKQLASDRAR
jgi:hypothetical protein